MLVSRAVAIACLRALGWMLFLVALLLGVLIAVGAFRGNGDGAMLDQMAAGVVAAGLGSGCRVAARWLERAA